MLQVVIVDDEPLALEVLEGYLKKMEHIQSVTLFSKARDALAYLQNQKADILFLDIEMPEMTGIEFLEKLTDPPLTIFTTAYRTYAFEGFELGVIDFLLKPISYGRFSAAIVKAIDFLSLKIQGTQVDSGELMPDFIFVKSGVKRIKLHFNEVSHIQGLKDYAIIHTAKEKIVIKGSIKMVQEMFPSSLFVRVHKSFLVVKKAINRIERNRIIIGCYQIPIGRNYREEVEKSIRMN
ncbi:LytTR family DNA-binding domain-containing protein [Rhodocytophaga aerolata]|uniref:LytTR family DNA-binding domain-containing protein n=1 Tax=Rhodocytophaga aerolata TaxID=455078 RepID=A0ABT8RDV0_9BACT|nr:LytTR family DNA-binding domain-containing protein [Rhodocytophaga aerolata]MDO1450277.1 LytTR family DNA-binding domain-containing protein [Rhodocytophaga aerolata]